MYYFLVILLIAFISPFFITVHAAHIPVGIQLANNQEIIRHIKDEPVSLDPAKAVGLPEAQILRDLFEGLVNQNAQGNPEPGVAQSWKTTDNKRYTFKLRKNAKWSNGKPVTAYDFMYSWQRLVNPKTLSPFAWIAKIASIDNADKIIHGRISIQKLGVFAPDIHTLIVQLNKPVPFFINLLTNVSFFPVSQQNIKQYGKDWTKPEHLVGNGAFLIKERVVNEKIVLHSNPYYWDHDNTILTKVTFLPINQESTVIKRYLANEIDITESFPRNMYHKLMKDIPDQVYIPCQLGTYYYAFNTQKPPLNNILVRRALSYAIDRNIITTKVLGTGEKPAYQLTPDITTGFKVVPLNIYKMTQIERNKQAKKWLQEAGYGVHIPLQLKLLYNTSENNQNIAIAVASMWKKVLGVQVTLTNQEWKTYIDSRDTGNFEVVRASWVGDYNEASTFLSLLTSTHNGNISKFNNPNYDMLLNIASKETNTIKRNAKYEEAEQIIAEQVPIAPIYQYTNGRLIKQWVKGYPINNPEDVAYSQNMYIIQH
ncbi:Periplasmic murein peptide-binding protein [Candidatus Profftia lariciata]|uniref:peptide ABC transporter substrate-binding protein n=1 Tax=Candidatus Profftia lariciata TaxID=1987921 RepID=UPI001D026184|nr:peptide ABC transporter substrate-binding protein [Candidatus Profftia lariciata]UDG81714.1 Periplasmic murein peptide-binding protein [Candidatus Profftia lariciata]